MRRLLVDHARAKQRDKRGGKAADLTFDEAAVVTEDNLPMILELDIALDKLATINENMAAGIQLLYFGGLTYDEAAEQLGVSRTVFYEDLKFAKAWLRRELSAGDG
jgi:RNA polymerase sigma factor (TIGR02999 family)